MKTSAVSPLAPKNTSDTSWKHGLLRDLYDIVGLKVILSSCKVSETAIHSGFTSPHSRLFQQEETLLGSVLHEDGIVFSVKMNGLTTSLPSAVCNLQHVDDFQISCKSSGMQLAKDSSGQPLTLWVSGQY